MSSPPPQHSNSSKPKGSSGRESKRQATKHEQRRLVRLVSMLPNPEAIAGLLEKGPSAVTAIFVALSNPPMPKRAEGFRKSVLDILKQFGPGIEDILIQHARTGYSYTGPIAIQALAIRKDPNAAATLCSTLAFQDNQFTHDWQIRELVAKALGELGDSTAIPGMVEAARREADQWAKKCTAIHPRQSALDHAFSCAKPLDFSRDDPEAYHHRDVFNQILESVESILAAEPAGILRVEKAAKSNPTTRQLCIRILERLQAHSTRLSQRAHLAMVLERLKPAEPEDEGNRSEPPVFS